MDDKWRVFQTRLTADPMHKHRFEVEFWPNELAGTGEEEPTEPGTMVIIEDQGELTVVGFHPSVKQYVDMQRGDFEERALELVREHLEGA